MYQDFENKKLRNLTPEEVCAMYHFHDEYVRLGIGAIAFYANLTLGNKNFIARMVSDVVKHTAQHTLAGGRGCTCAHRKDGSIMLYSKACPNPIHADKA